MKIAICGSMAFASEMVEVKNQLEQSGHFVYLPEETSSYIEDPEQTMREAVDDRIGAERKIQYDLIRKHYEKIQNSDAILVLNYDRKGTRGYSGGNTFLEMGFAHILRKPIYLVQDPPQGMPFLLEEVMAMQPVVLGDTFAGLEA